MRWIAVGRQMGDTYSGWKLIQSDSAGNASMGCLHSRWRPDPTRFLLVESQQLHQTSPGHILDILDIFPTYFNHAFILFCRGDPSSGHPGGASGSGCSDVVTLCDDFTSCDEVNCRAALIYFQLNADEVETLCPDSLSLVPARKRLQEYQVGTQSEFVTVRGKEFSQFSQFSRQS